ncbi:hypothetical protein PENTCL1PPCAC_19715, partial [Pristionchus entomophagus]
SDHVSFVHDWDFLVHWSVLSVIDIEWQVGLLLVIVDVQGEAGDHLHHQGYGHQPEFGNAHWVGGGQEHLHARNDHLIVEEEWLVLSLACLDNPLVVRNVRHNRCSEKKVESECYGEGQLKRKGEDGKCVYEALRNLHPE